MEEGRGGDGEAKAAFSPVFRDRSRRRMLQRSRDQLAESHESGWSEARCVRGSGLQLLVHTLSPVA